MLYHIDHITLHTLQSDDRRQETSTKFQHNTISQHGTDK